MIEAMKQALEALERSVATCYDQYAHQQAMSQPDHFINQTITSLRKAIQEEALRNVQRIGQEIEQEPVAWDSNDKNFDAWWDSEYDDSTNPYRINTPAYWAWAGWKASQPQRTWVGLTDEEIEDIVEDCDGIGWDVAQAIVDRLKQKNGFAEEKNT